MGREIELRCRCGTVRGAVTDVRPSNCTHAVCYCDDCQAFARWLAIDGVANARGGTEVVQVAPAQVRWIEGTDRLRCMRLSPKGLLRWYADCCRTPVGNMMSARVPFVGLPAMLFAELPPEAVGPAVGVQGRFAKGGVPDGVSARAPLGIIGHAIWMMTRWWIGGRGRPSPYFDESGTPRATPKVIGDADGRRSRRDHDR
jgi:hypothetical protein